MLVTGHTGFKGAWLCLWLQQLGARVVGVALPPYTDPNLFELLDTPVESDYLDIRDFAALEAAFSRVEPQIVIHMAAQALVRESYKDPLATYATNVMGSAHVLEACRTLQGLQSVLMVTSDKVYDNDGSGHAFIESDRLGGHDPYSNSKACSELVTQSFRDSFFERGPRVATARAGNVIGGGDWSTDRLIPDCVRALTEEEPVSLRYPEAIRPWQHVLEPLSGYLEYAQALAADRAALPPALNFGPHPTSFCPVRQVVDLFSARFGGKPGWHSDVKEQPTEAAALTLSSTLAQQVLSWQPTLSVAQSVQWTADWYGAFLAGEHMREFTKEQLARFCALAGHDT